MPAEREGLRAQGLRFNYGSAVVLDGVDLWVPPGQWWAVIGPNGCGKSTLVKLLMGLLTPRAGELTVDGDRVLDLSARERGRRLGFLPQQGPRPEGLTVREVVALGRLPQLGLLGRPGPEDQEAVTRALEVTESLSLERREVSTLSGGEAQRVLLARALASRPRYLLLDEPTNHLDLHHQVAFLRLLKGLREEGVGVLTVLHDPNQAVGADGVVLMNRGRVVVAGAPEVAITSESLAALYGGEVTLERTLSGRQVILSRLEGK